MTSGELLIVLSTKVNLLYLLYSTGRRCCLLHLTKQNGKSSQEYPVNAVVPQGSILGRALFLLYISDLPDDFICDIATYADKTTLCSKCDWASNL